MEIYKTDNKYNDPQVLHFEALHKALCIIVQIEISNLILASTAKCNGGYIYIISLTLSRLNNRSLSYDVYLEFFFFIK